MNNRFHNILAKGCLLMILCSTFVQISAQQADTTKKWNFLADVYLMFPYMDGETGIGENLILPVDATAGDIFSNLKLGAMVYLEAKTDKWTITSDFVYMNLNQEITPTVLLNSGEVTFRQFIWETAGLYRITDFWDAGIGGRLNYLEAEVDARINQIPGGTEGVFGRKHKTWWDPLIITKLKTDINDSWLLQFRGDVGGFGVGSDLTWQLQGYVGYRFTELFQLTGGYRVLYNDYANGTAPREFVFNMYEHGPVIRFGFNF